MIYLNNVSKSFGKKRVLNSISLKFKRGEVSFLCGPNGAGKTTMLRLILGILKPDKGSIDINGNKKFSFMFHSISLIEEISLLNNMRFFCRLNNIPFDEAKIREYANMLGLEDELSNIVSDFSEGMKKKADFLRILIEDSDFVLLDEPTANMDPVAKVEIRKIVKQLADKGKGIVITSHLLNEVEKFADSIFVIDKGELKWQGKREDLNEEGKDLEEKFLELIGVKGD